MKRALTIIITAAVLLAATQAAQATVYYVDFDNGNDTNQGIDRTAPWQHLPGTVGQNGAGWVVLQDGDVIYVKGGTANPVQVKISSKDWYRGNARYDSIRIVGGQFAIPSWGTGMPVFDEEFVRTFGFWIGAGAVTKGITLDGLEIKNIAGGATGPGFDDRNGSATINIGGAYAPAYITIRRSYLHDALRNADDRGHGIEGAGGDHFIFEYNTIGPNIGTKGIEPNAMSYGIIRNNYISNCGDHAVALTRASHFDVYNNVINYLPPQIHEPAYGISMAQAAYCDIWNNLIYRSEPPINKIEAGPYGESYFWYSSLGMGMYTNDTGMRIVNNTVAFFGDFRNAGSSTMIRVGDSVATYLNEGTVFANNIFYKGFNAAGNIQYAVRLNTVNNEDVQYNDFFNSSPQEKVMAKFDGASWSYFSVSDFPASAGHTYAHNTQIEPVFSQGSMPSGIDASGHPNSSYFSLTADSPVQVQTTGNAISGDTIHGYSSDPNKFATDIVGNQRTSWSIGAYEYVPAHYIRADASAGGDGTSWQSAWQTFPQTFQRGHTYYVASGSYGYIRFIAADAGSTPITIRKATAALHGTDLGWQDSYGTGPADFTGFYIKLDYLEIDGQEGAAAADWSGYEPYGIRVRDYMSKDQVILILIGDNLTHRTNVTLKHIDVSFTNTTNWYRMGSLLWAYAENLTVQNCWFHNAEDSSVNFQAGGGSLWDHCFLEENGQGQYYMHFSPSEHSAVMNFANGTHDHTVRYSVIRRVRSSGGLLFGIGSVSNVTVYGNIFTSGDDGTVFNGGGNGILNGEGGDYYSNIKVYNNTFADIPTLTGGRIGTIGIYDTNFEIKNNLFFNIPNLSVNIAAQRSHNWYCQVGNFYDYASEDNVQIGAGDPFVNRSGNNYHLNTHTQQGVNLGDPYTIDSDGTTRSLWDRGAYEYVPSFDVSGDGAITAYDAALALQLGRGELEAAQIAQQAVVL